MRIVLLSHEYPPFVGGGIGAYTDSAARHLAAAGHEVHVVTNAATFGSTLPVVCSEFEGVFWNPWRLPQFIGELLTARRQMPGVIGAQVWGFLQSNFVTLDPAIVPRRGLEWASPIDPFVDGVLKPLAPGATPGTGLNVIPFDPNGFSAVQQWTSAP